MAATVKLNPSALKELRKVNPCLMSYNIEMTEVTGGTFWKEYTPAQIAGTEEFPPIKDLREMAGLMQVYPPIDLSGEKVRRLARAFGPVWVRVSGTWASKTYYDFDGSMEGKAPEPEKRKRKPKAEKATEAEKDQYQKYLDELRDVNDAIPDEEMSNKISRLEAVSAKIFEQAKTDPEKLPRMRKFMEYYLPTSLKLLQTYAELDAQGVEGENISESKRRIEQTMDTLVQAFETQLDQLFQSDAMDVSADIDVMENMLRADGLTGEAPFKL